MKAGSVKEWTEKKKLVKEHYSTVLEIMSYIPLIVSSSGTSLY